MRNIEKKSMLSTSISILLSLSLVIFIVGIILLSRIIINNSIDREKENFVMTIQLNEVSSPELFLIEKEKFRKYLIRSGFFKKVYFTDKQEIAKNLNLEENFLEYCTDKESPIPHEFNVNLYAKYMTSSEINKVKDYINDYDFIESNNLISGILVDNKNINEMNQNVDKVSVFLIPLSIIFFVISFALINNTIRLSIGSKRLLIRTMRLVGATDMFIQKPYLINSIFQGISSSIIAIFMIIGCVEFVEIADPNIINQNDFTQIGFIFLIIIIFGILISWASTFFAVRKYLNLNEQELYN